MRYLQHSDPIALRKHLAQFSWLNFDVIGDNNKCRADLRRQKDVDDAWVEAERRRLKDDVTAAHAELLPKTSR